MNTTIMSSTFDKPYKYKKLLIYPVKVESYYEFLIYSNSLTLEKNSTPSPKIIEMGYLEYLMWSTMEDMEKTPYIFWLDRLLSICLRDEREFDDFEGSIQRYKVDENNKVFFIINGEKYDEYDFEEIKKIIAEQNLIELPDENMSKDVRDSLEAARRYKERLSGSTPGSFEDYIISLAITTGWSFEYIYSLTIRKFMNSIRRLDNLIHYKIYLNASMSGMVEFKDKSFIKHWLNNLEDKDKYGDVSMDLDNMQNKISMESAKK